MVNSGICGGSSHPLSNIILYSAGSPGSLACVVCGSWVGSSVGGLVSWGGDVRLTRVLASTLMLA